MADVMSLRAECARNGLSINELAKKISVNPSTLHRKLAGQAEFKLGEINSIKNILHLDDSQIIDIFFNKNVA